jgi:hypothetical protein
MTLVWYRLVFIGDDAESNSTFNDNIEERNLPDDQIEVKTTDFTNFTISQMKKAVKKECSNKLAHLDANELKVYRPGTAASVPEGTVPCPVGSNVGEHETTPANGYIVVAPPQPQSSPDIGDLRALSAMVEELMAEKENRAYQQQQA